MSERSTAEIVAELLTVEVVAPVWTGNRFSMMSNHTWEHRYPSRLAREAAHRLAELDALIWAPPTGERIPGVPPWQAGRRLQTEVRP